MDTFALILSVIGSLNWGLVGIFKFDLVAWIFGGQTSVISRIIYTLVGLAGIWCISVPQACACQCRGYVTASAQAQSRLRRRLCFHIRLICPRKKVPRNSVGVLFS